MAATTAKCYLLSLPPEVRLIICRFYLTSPPFGCHSNTSGLASNTDPTIYGELHNLKTNSTLLRTCHSIRKEAMPLFQDAMEAGVQYWLAATAESQQQILHSHRPEAGFRLYTNWDAVVVKMNLQMWLAGSQAIEQFSASIQPH